MKTNKHRVGIVLNNLLNIETETKKKRYRRERNVSVYNFWFSESVVACLARRRAARVWSYSAISLDRRRSNSAQWNFGDYWRIGYEFSCGLIRIFLSWPQNQKLEGETERLAVFRGCLQFFCNLSVTPIHRITHFQLYNNSDLMAISRWVAKVTISFIWPFIVLPFETTYTPCVPEKKKF